MGKASRTGMAVAVGIILAGATTAHCQERGRVTTVVSGFQAGGGLAVDAEGNFYASDFQGEGAPGQPQGSVVRRITPDGDIEPFTTEVLTPTGLMFGPSGDLYVSNAYPNSIVRVTPDGTTSTFAEHIAWPSAILFDSTGNVFSPNCTNESRTATGQSIFKVTPSGEVSTYLTSPLLQCGVGIVFGDDGNMYVSNWNDRAILKITPDRDVSILATIPGEGREPIANMVHISGNLYVAGFGTHRIWQISLDGEVSVLAGSGAPGSEDGVGTSATFNQPNGIAISNSGDALWIMDVGGESASIRRVELGT